ncbi:MAG TPA: fluoride efflux transporter CrcB [Gemmatimonadaceae bacterium]
MRALLIFFGAGLGGVARHAVGSWIHTAAGSGFPWGTLLVNVTGSLLLAGTYVLLEGMALAPEWHAFLGIGILGGYTTFSSFSYETLRLMQDGQWLRAWAYAAGSVMLCLMAAVLGFQLALIVLRRG